MKFSERRPRRCASALAELQEFVSGPASDAFTDEVVLRLSGSEPEAANRALAEVGDLLLEQVLVANPTISPTLANGLVYASLEAIRSRLALTACAGIA